MTDTFQTDGRNDSGQDVNQFSAPELSPQEYADHTAQTMARILESTGLIVVREVNANPGQVHLLGRVKAEDERMFVEQIVRPSLVCMDAGDCDGFIGKQYFLRGEGKGTKVMYGWIYSFGSKNLSEAATTLAAALETAVPSLIVTESPLLGAAAPQSGGRATGRKGASPVK